MCAGHDRVGVSSAARRADSASIADKSPVSVNRSVPA
ncbi:hypothetical protein X738_24895 [Mesorhizobium sp. LNHC209A00]|nr:hypothetical protein X738_24895 [Mesorhizobium sp. LNHC209A00]